MAYGAIELATITRLQDYSTMKQNEDNRGMMQQTNLGNQMQKTTQQRMQEVNRGDDTAWHEQRPDAREKGNGQYFGDGGKRRREAVVKKSRDKSQGGFDMKI